MPVNFPEYKAALEAAHKAARSAPDIDTALNIVTAGYTAALQKAVSEMTVTTTVATPNTTTGTGTGTVA